MKRDKKGRERLRKSIGLQEVCGVDIRKSGLQTDSKKWWVGGARGKSWQASE